MTQPLDPTALSVRARQVLSVLADSFELATQGQPVTMPSTTVPVEDAIALVAALRALASPATPATEGQKEMKNDG